MAASVSNVYDVLECVKQEVEELCKQEAVSPLLVWLLLRQQADYQLLLLKNSTDPRQEGAWYRLKDYDPVTQEYTDSNSD